MARYGFFLRVGGQGIGARQIDDAHGLAREQADVAFLFFNGDARIVAHMLMGARERIEGRRFSRVGVAREGYGEF